MYSNRLRKVRNNRGFFKKKVVIGEKGVLTINKYQPKIQQKATRLAPMNFSVLNPMKFVSLDIQ